MVDFFATDEDHYKKIKLISRSEAKINDKRDGCRDYINKFLSHIQLMRKDLLSIDNNDDAVCLNDEMRGITDVIF